MRFSAIMPSYLGDYPGAASGRPGKLMRAVESVLSQTFTDWQLAVCADGCPLTFEILKRYNDPRIKIIFTDKQPLWSPAPRNAALSIAEGEWIVYLDTDDYWREDHLAVINEAIESMDMPSVWGYFNAWFYNTSVKSFVEREVNIAKCRTYGTANIVHRNDGTYWPDQGRDRSGRYDYGTQDCAFVDVLKKKGAGVRLPTPGYMVCHEPNLLRIDV